jgi:hypothetical protein
MDILRAVFYGASLTTSRPTSCPGCEHLMTTLNNTGKEIFLLHRLLTTVLGITDRLYT